MQRVAQENMNQTQRNAVIAKPASAVTTHSESSIATTNKTLSETCAPSQDLPLQEAVRRHPKAVAYMLTVASASLLLGYSLSVSQGVTALPAFQHDFGVAFGHRYIIPSRWLSLWSMLGPLGGMMGSLACAHIQDRWGRRLPLALSGVVSAVAIAVLYTSNLPSQRDARRGLFLLGKISQDFANGMIGVQGQTYISEAAPTSLRGPALTLPGAFTALGHLIGASAMLSRAEIRSSAAYAVVLASQWPFAVVPLVVWAVAPESPVYLARKEQHDKALYAHRKLGTLESEHNRQSRPSLHEHQASVSSYYQCFTNGNLRRTLVVLFVSWIPVFTGLSLWSAIGYIMQLVGMTPHYSLVIMLVSVGLSTAAHAGGIWTTSRFGRRPLILTSLAVASALYLVMGLAGIWSGNIAMWLSAVSLLLVIAVCSLGASPAASAVAAEASALHLRSKTQGLSGVSAHISNVLFGAVVPFMYNPDAGTLRTKVGLVFAGFCILTLVGARLVVPELKGRSAAEIDAMFELKLKARQFKDWDTGRYGIWSPHQTGLDGYHRRSLEGVRSLSDTSRCAHSSA